MSDERWRFHRQMRRPRENTSPRAERVIRLREADWRQHDRLYGGGRAGRRAFTGWRKLSRHLVGPLMLLVILSLWGHGLGRSCARTPWQLVAYIAQR